MVMRRSWWLVAKVDPWRLKRLPNIRFKLRALKTTVDVSYAAPQTHEIVNVALHWEYSPGIIFIFSHGRKYLYHV
jgi:hypothetical protein